MVAAKVEPAQKAAQVLLARGWPQILPAGGAVFDQADHVLQRRVGGAQHVQLLLGKVADVQPLPSSISPLIGASARGDGFDHGGLALAVGAQDADALAGQHRAC
jgi:hypothetical protein